MRNTVIDIYQASQKDRARLYDHLIALGEPIYSGTGLRDKEYSCIVFDYETSTSRWSGGGSANLKDAISIDAFIEKYPVTTQESEKDYAIICKDSSIEDRNLIYLHLENLNYKMYKHTNFITLQNYTSSDTVYSYDKEQWQTDGRKSITTHIKLISVKDFIAKFIKTSKQSLIEQDSSVQIGQKYRNSSGNINIITKISPSTVRYTPENSSIEYSCTAENVKKNWKLISEAENTQTPTTYQIIKKDKYKVGAKVKIREDLRKHHNTNFKMCELAGTVVTIIKHSTPAGYTFKGSDTYYWAADMFEGEVIEPQIEPQPTISQEQKFKIGDKVKLKDDLKDEKIYNGITYFDVFKSHIATGIISKIQKTSVGYQYYIDKIWYGEDTLELDTSIPLASKYPIGFIFSIDCAHKPRGLKVIEIKQDTVRGTNYNLQYVDTGTTTGFVSESFIDNEVASTTLATVPIKEASLVVSSAASAVSIKKFDGVTGTPLGGTNQPTIKREKKSMAKAIKDTAIATLDQNKQAAIIAGKMEAGRILNKQIIKQIKPHIPMFVRGYLDTTLAPVVVANLVAAIGNHTQNKRVQQVSELMLLAAADTTVQSFNLDKIIDDVLAGVKLPAGILDTHEE